MLTGRGARPGFITPFPHLGNRGPGGMGAFNTSPYNYPNILLILETYGRQPF